MERWQGSATSPKGAASVHTFPDGTAGAIGPRRRRRGKGPRWRVGARPGQCPADVAAARTASRAVCPASRARPGPRTARWPVGSLLAGDLIRPPGGGSAARPRESAARRRERRTRQRRQRRRDIDHVVGGPRQLDQRRHTRGDVGSRPLAAPRTQTARAPSLSHETYALTFASSPNSDVSCSAMRRTFSS